MSRTPPPLGSIKVSKYGTPILGKETPEQARRAELHNVTSSSRGRKKVVSLPVLRLPPLRGSK